MHQVECISFCYLSWVDIADKSVVVAQNKARLIMAMDASEMLTFPVQTPFKKILTPNFHYHIIPAGDNFHNWKIPRRGCNFYKKN